MLVPHCHRPAPMPVLLRLLLITLLVVNTTASAWAASAMAVSLVPAGNPAQYDAADAAMASDCHGQASQAQDPMPCGSDSQHCDCLHYASALFAHYGLNLTAIPRAGPHSLPPAGNPPPHLADPVRPPITSHA